MAALQEKAFKDHLHEFQSRLLISAICVGVGAFVAYFYHEQILSFLIRPLGGPLYYTTPTGGFDLVFKISIISGIFVASPILAYQILAFLEPVLPNETARSINRFLLLSWVLFISGAAAAYYLSLPAALKLLNEFSSKDVKAIISTKDYFSFILSYLGGFALIFQLPVLLLLCNKIVPLKPKMLIRYLRHVVIISFVLAAILTPTPDPINQSIMAAPIILLYLFSIIGIWFVNSSVKSKELKQNLLLDSTDDFFPTHGALLLISGQLPYRYYNETKRHFRFMR